MEPTLKQGSLVWVNNWAFLFSKPRVGDIVIFKVNNQELVKRIKNLEKEGATLVGDNPLDSYDSANFGLISFSQIVGKVVKKPTHGLFPEI